MANAFDERRKGLKRMKMTAHWTETEHLPTESVYAIERHFTDKSGSKQRVQVDYVKRVHTSRAAKIAKETSE